jgi:hypothetical protein
MGCEDKVGGMCHKLIMELLRTYPRRPFTIGVNTSLLIYKIIAFGTNAYSNARSSMVNLSENFWASLTIFSRFVR